MAQAQVSVCVTDWPWFREILVRGGDLVEALADVELPEDARRRLRTFEQVLTLQTPEQDIAADFG